MLKTLGAPPRGLQVPATLSDRHTARPATAGRRVAACQALWSRTRKTRNGPSNAPSDITNEDQERPEPPRSPLAALQHLVAGVAATTATSAAAALCALFLSPTGAARAALDAPLPMDPELMGAAAENMDTPPEIAQLMAFVVVAYIALMAAYIWLASMIDEEEGSTTTRGRGGAENDASSGSSGGSGGAQLPPGYGDMLHAHIRSVKEPKRGHALVAPPMPEDGGEGTLGGVAVIKAAFARQAADYVAQQVKEAGSVVRRKIYLRRLAAQEAARGAVSNGRHNGNMHAAAAALPALPVDLEGLLMSEPGQLEAMVDRCLDNLPVDVLADDACESTIVRSVTGAVARSLAAAEAGELVRTLAAEVRARRSHPTTPTAFGI